MPIFAHDNTDLDILNDLLQEINELYESSEQTLIELEITPSDNELQRALFRSVHTIKGDLGLVGFTPLFGIMQKGEDLLDYLRKGQLHYSSHLSDVVLLILDRVTSFVGECITQGQVEYDDAHFSAIEAAVGAVTPECQADHETLLLAAISVLKGKTAPADHTPVETDERFFYTLMQPIEIRVDGGIGRGPYLAQLARLVNTHAGHIINDGQLALACHVYHFGMGLMPVDLIHSHDKTQQARRQFYAYVYKSARLLEHLETWDVARKIVIQHQERHDGSGYPMGIAGEEICQGARLVAILDTFYNIRQTLRQQAQDPTGQGASHDVVTQQRAMDELNGHMSSRFCPVWLARVNHVMTRVLSL